MVNGTNNDLVIVGIDPGTTSAVVILDTDGDLVTSKSAKNFSKDQIIECIVSHGKPLIIGTDVAPAPSLIADIASNMGAVLHVPDENLQASYKEELVQDLNLPQSDTHTMDAAAAAVYAYRIHEDQLIRVKRRADDAELTPSQTRDVIEQVVNGTSTSTAINTVQETNDDDGNNSGRDWQQIAERRQQEINRLKQKISRLESYADELEEQVGSASATATVNDEELKQRNREITSLRATVDELETNLEQATAERDALRNGLHRIVDDDWLYVPKTENLDVDTDIVYCDRYRGGNVSVSVDIVLTATDVIQTERYRNLEQHGITVIDISTVDPIIDVGRGYIVAPDALETADDGEQGFVEWLDEYKQRQTP